MIVKQKVIVVLKAMNKIFLTITNDNLDFTNKDHTITSSMLINVILSQINFTKFTITSNSCVKIPDFLSMTKNVIQEYFVISS